MRYHLVLLADPPLLPIPASADIVGCAGGVNAIELRANGLLIAEWSYGWKGLCYAGQDVAMNDVTTTRSPAAATMPHCSRWARRASRCSHITARGAEGTALAMQGDGNGVIYNGSGQGVWHTATYGHKGAQLAIQNDGNLDILATEGMPLWSSNACCH